VRTTIAAKFTAQLTKNFPKKDKAELSAKGDAIELALFKLYDSMVNSGYKTQNRTLLSNLMNSKNTDLRKRIVSGDITPDALVRMTSDELAGAEVVQARRNLQRASVQDSVIESSTIRIVHQNEKDIDRLEEEAQERLLREDRKLVAVPKSVMDTDDTGPAEPESTPTSPAARAAKAVANSNEGDAVDDNVDASGLEMDTSIQSSAPVVVPARFTAAPVSAPKADVEPSVEEPEQKEPDENCVWAGHIKNSGVAKVNVTNHGRLLLCWWGVRQACAGQRCDDV